MTNKELILAQLMRAMIKYDGGDAPRIQHFVKVHDIIEVAKIPFSSPTANWMTYGGIPVGKITEFFGGEGGGKTTSALDICANAQKKFNEVFEQHREKVLDEVEQLREKDTKESKKKADKIERGFGRNSNGRNYG